MAEHPDAMDAEDYDLSGFCVGVVDRPKMITGAEIAPGDVVLGLASSGLHANGYSLVRRLLDDGALDLSEELLEPTRLYAPAVLRLIDDLRAAGQPVRGLAHVTGGGLAGNLPRAVPAPLAAEIDPRGWPEPPIFATVARAAGMSEPEMRATFNCGIGMAAVVAPDSIAGAMASLDTSGHQAWVIGRVVPAAGDARYRERP